MRTFKYMWKHHRPFVLLTWAYLVPAIAGYVVIRDANAAICVGSLGILLTAPLIWKLK